MSNYHFSRMPLHVQNADIAKAAKDNPSYESFRPNIMHPTGMYGGKFDDDRPSSMNDQSRIRRYPSGVLDMMWTANQIIDAIHKTEFNGKTGDPNYGSASLLPIEAALLTVVFPATYRKMEPQQATILTQLSSSEKEQLSIIVMKQLQDEDGYNAGFGGGSNMLSRPRNVGG